MTLKWTRGPLGWVATHGKLVARIDKVQCCRKGENKSFTGYRLIVAGSNKGAHETLAEAKRSATTTINQLTGE